MKHLNKVYRKDDMYEITALGVEDGDYGKATGFLAMNGVFGNEQMADVRFMQTFSV